MLFDLGAMYYAAVKIESYREAASDALAATKIPEEHIQELKKLLE
jgi:hypothetical protein